MAAAASPESSPASRASSMASAAVDVPKRLIVSWNATGRPSEPVISASPSRITERHGSARATATTRGSRAVTSLRLR